MTLSASDMKDVATISVGGRVPSPGDSEIARGGGTPPADDKDLVNGGARAAARVRGLRADRSAPVHLCRHCGTPVAAKDAEFCCAGCAYVHGLVHAHGLEG